MPYTWIDLVHLFMHFILNGLETMSTYSEIMIKYYDGWLSEPCCPGQYSISHLTLNYHLSFISQILILFCFSIYYLYTVSCSLLSFTLYSAQLNCAVRFARIHFHYRIYVVLFLYQLIRRWFVAVICLSFLLLLFSCVCILKRGHFNYEADGSY